MRLFPKKNQLRQSYVIPSVTIHALYIKYFFMRLFLIIHQDQDYKQHRNVNDFIVGG